jgi:predicted hydrocarbon binding protein
MQGILFVELSRYLDERFGAGAWQGILAAEELSERDYRPDRAAPDEEFVRLIQRAAAESDEDVETTLEDFGQYLGSELLGGLYGMLIDPSWDLMEFLEHAEGTIHTVVRARDPNANPPRLHAERAGPDDLVIGYDSPRRLCSLAKGIVRAAARHFDETVELDESSCMLRGDDRCEIAVRRQPAVVRIEAGS